MCALRVGDIDIDSLVVRFPTGKTGAREVPISPEIGDVSPEIGDVVRCWVAERHHDAPASAPMFGRTFRPQEGGDWMVSALRIACKHAQVERFTTHALRYRAVIDMMDAGVDAKTAAEITGHDVKTMLTIYRRTSSTTKREAILRAKLGHLPQAPGQVIEFNNKGGDR